MQYTFKSDLNLNEEYREYYEYLPFLYEHREEIYANANYFYAKLPFNVHTAAKASRLGVILKACEKGEPYHLVSEDGEREEFIASYAGNPMTGTTSGTKLVVTDHVVEAKVFQYNHFMLLAHRLRECLDESELPYVESTLTVHDVIQQLINPR